MGKKPSQPPPEARPASPFHNPFAKLKESLRDLPPGPVPDSAPGSAPGPEAPPRAVVRMERKGRGGKEVTVVEQLALPPSELEVWLKALKQALGCGGAIEEGALVVQGDHRARVKVWLEGRGVRRVSLSG